MHLNSLKIKIIIIFSLPAIALIYFTYAFLNTKYIQYKQSSSYALAAQNTLLVSKLIHSLQIERGLSSGYIISQDKEIRKKLINQQLVVNNKLKKYKRIHFQNIHNLNKIKKIRAAVLNSSISFQDEMSYYNQLNKNLINKISNLMSHLNIINAKSLVILQKLKEYAGQKRAYIYYKILSKNNEKYIFFKTIRSIEEKEKELKNTLFECATQKTISLFHKDIKINTLQELHTIQKQFYNNMLHSKEDANKWFHISSTYISKLQKISSTILNNIVSKSLKIQNKIKISLSLALLFWILSIISFFVLLFILYKLIKKEEELLKKVRIASYTFDSHEAIVITNKKGKILEVNKAFTKITGYEANEVIGKNPHILKSGKHTNEFFKDMWQHLLSVGQWTGEIYNKRKNGEIYSEQLSITAIKNNDGEIINFVAHFYDISDLKKAQEDMLYQANHDFLTGIFNRKSLLQRLHEENAKALRHNFIHAFLFIDLDNFKYVNDTFGHHIGDILLVEVSHRIKKILREEDILARMGGDEFAIILTNIAHSKEKAEEYASKKCEKIIETLSNDFIIEKHTIHIGASIGIKIFPDEKNNIETLINDADKAMYASKKNGKNKCSLYSEI